MEIDLSNAKSAKKAAIWLFDEDNVECIGKYFDGDTDNDISKIIKNKHTNIAECTIKLFHYTTVSNTYKNTFLEEGILDLAAIFSNPEVPLSAFLRDHEIVIDVENKTIKHGNYCYKLQNEVENNRSGQSGSNILKRLQGDSCINGFVGEKTQPYSVIDHYPEILMNIDNYLNLNGELMNGWKREFSPKTIVIRVPIGELIGFDATNSGVIEKIAFRAWKHGCCGDSEYEDHDILSLQMGQGVKPNQILNKADLLD